MGRVEVVTEELMLARSEECGDDVIPLIELASSASSAERAREAAE